MEMSAVGEGVLECIALNCPRMAEIGLFHVSDGITEAGLVALATRCTKLELLVLHPDCEVMTSFAKQLWVLLRPGLEIHTEEEDELAFDVETQIDWYSNT